MNIVKITGACYLEKRLLRGFYTLIVWLLHTYYVIGIHTARQLGVTVCVLMVYICHIRCIQTLALEILSVLREKSVNKARDQNFLHFSGGLI